jgi:hypothetical protein
MNARSANRHYRALGGRNPGTRNGSPLTIRSIRPKQARDNDNRNFQDAYFAERAVDEQYHGVSQIPGMRPSHETLISATSLRNEHGLHGLDGQVHVEYQAAGVRRQKEFLNRGLPARDSRLHGTHSATDRG